MTYEIHGYFLTYLTFPLPAQRGHRTRPPEVQAVHLELNDLGP